MHETINSTICDSVVSTRAWRWSTQRGTWSSIAENKCRCRSEGYGLMHETYLEKKGHSAGAWLLLRLFRSQAFYMFHVFLKCSDLLLVFCELTRSQLSQGRLASLVVCLSNQSINSLQCQMAPSEPPNPLPPSRTHAHTHSAKCSVEQSMLYQPIYAKALWVILYINSWH